MKQPSVADLAIGKSRIRRRILVLLLRDPAGKYHLREIQRRAATTPGTASRELANLESAGLILREPDGRQVYFRAAQTPFTEMLRSMIEAEEGAPEQRPGPSPADLAVASRFADAMRAEYEGRLRKAFLVGSRARGDARLDSDVNFLVVLDRIESYYDEIERTSQAVNALSLDIGVVVRRTFVTERQWEELDQPFLARARGEGVAL